MKHKIFPNEIKKISPAIQELLRIFVKKNYPTLTLNDLTDYLPQYDKDTINRRILRDNGAIFQSEGKPKKIRVKPDLPEVVLFQNHYECRRCRKKFGSEPFYIQLKNERNEPDKYENYLTICESCFKKDKKPDTEEILREDYIAQLSRQPHRYKIIEVGLYNIYDDRFFMSVKEVIKIREMTEFGPEEGWKVIYANNIEKNEKFILGIQGVINTFAAAGWELAFEPRLERLYNTLDYPEPCCLIFQKIFRQEVQK